MSNIKFYTEEQVNQIIDRAYDLELGTDEQMTGYLMMNITPIELPSDEEIEKYADYEQNFIDGAKWMKEQILNQNKELLILDFDKVKEEWIREANGMTDLEKANYYHQKIQKNENR